MPDLSRGTPPISQLTQGYAPVDYELASYRWNSGTVSVGVALDTLLAGEDTVNGGIVSLSKTTTTKTQDNLAHGSAGVGTSGTISSGIYRKYRAFGAGASGNFDLKLEVSPDGGTSGWYYVNNAGSSQYPLLVGDLVAPYVRVITTNQHAGTQAINVWLVLST